MIDTTDSKYIQHGANDWNYGLSEVCSSRHFELVNLIIQHGANDWDCGLSKACLCGNNIEIVNLMIQHSANDWNFGLQCAIVGKHPKIIELMRSCINS